MTKTQVEVITSVQRRRRWSRAEKERIVAAALEPDAVASAVARKAGIHASQLYRWRQELCGRAGPGPRFAAVAIAAEPDVGRNTALPASPGLVEVELACGARMRISGAVDPATLSALVAALASARR
jgi:transposase